MQKELIITADGSHSIKYSSDFSLRENSERTMKPDFSLLEDELPEIDFDNPQTFPQVPENEENRFVMYHSKHGALQESVHVFIKAGLHELLPLQQPLTVFEMGFGTGLNALLTALEADRSKVQVSYNAVEAFPLEEEFWKQLNFCEVISENAGYKNLLAAENNLNCKNILTTLHSSRWNDTVQVTPYFDLIKFHSTIQDITLPEAINLVYFDAFAPDAQPELWTTEIFTRIAKAMAPDGILVTYCSKGYVRRNLQAAGLEVEKIPGPRGKREMLRARKPVRS
ncbi:MAG TPA: tRNA (5-methylaminomethyl-2-thiouridine)(34)-methyltransferase MnmD [Parasegetibacter sp.]